MAAPLAYAAVAGATKLIGSAFTWVMSNPVAQSVAINGVAMLAEKGIEKLSNKSETLGKVADVALDMTKATVNVKTGAGLDTSIAAVNAMNMASTLKAAVGEKGVKSLLDTQNLLKTTQLASSFIGVVNPQMAERVNNVAEMGHRINEHNNNKMRMH